MEKGKWGRKRLYLFPSLGSVTAVQIKYGVMLPVGHVLDKTNSPPNLKAASYPGCITSKPDYSAST
jgi:hypothetical protein